MGSEHIASLGRFLMLLEHPIKFNVCLCFISLIGRNWYEKIKFGKSSHVGYRLKALLKKRNMQ